MVPIPNLSFTGGAATSGGWGDTSFGGTGVNGGSGLFTANFAPGGTASSTAGADWLPWLLAAGAVVLAFVFMRR